MARLYEEPIQAEAPKRFTRKAVAEADCYGGAIAKIEADVLVLKWIVGALLVLEVAVFVAS